ncbi:lipocalin family protein [Shewanella sp.]|uniref:lipocalin family protein n=1 Tax=Shewanella sp. TaxID=50422 RepID=UPI004048C415
MLGTGSPIACLDHSFERNRSNVTAQYSIDNDKVVVINSGVKQVKQQWDSAEGKADVIDDDR